MKIFKALPTLATTLLLTLSHAAENTGDDLALEAPDVIVNPVGDLSKGSKPFQGIASIASSKSGKNVFCVWYGGSWGENFNNYLMCALSVDGGKTWSNVKLVVRSKHCGQVRCFDPAIWLSPDGALRLFWAQKHNGAKREASVWTMVCRDPENKPLEWSKPERLCYGVMMNKPITRKNGETLYPVGIFGKYPVICQDPSRISGAHCYAAKDPDATPDWRGGFVPMHNVFPEHMFVELKNGRIWALARRDTSQIANRKENGKLVKISGENSGIAQSYSSDGGRKWSRAELANIPSPSTRFFIGRLNSGNLLLVKNDAGDAEWLKNNSFKPADKCPRDKIMAYISKDDGKTWLGGLEVDDRKGLSYPDAAQSADGRIFVCYDKDRYKEQEIYNAVITEADILAGKLVDKNSQLKILVNKGEVEFKKPADEK